MLRNIKILSYKAMRPLTLPSVFQRLGLVVYSREHLAHVEYQFVD